MGKILLLIIISLFSFPKSNNLHKQSILQNKNETYHISFINSERWSLVYAYCYYENGTEITNSWCGNIMERKSEFWYEIDIEANSPFYIIFNNSGNGEGNQTINVLVSKDDVYINAQGIVFDSKEEAINNTEIKPLDYNPDDYILNMDEYKSNTVIIKEKINIMPICFIVILVFINIFILLKRGKKNG